MPIVDVRASGKRMAGQPSVRQVVTAAAPWLFAAAVALLALT